MRRSREKTNIVVSAQSIDRDQPAKYAHSNSDQHNPSHLDRGKELGFLKQKIHRRRKVSVRVSRCGILRLIRVDTLRSVYNLGFSRGKAQLYIIPYGLELLSIY